ncbi:ethylmalonyl-CoA decarboxylase-like isoform X2 [Cimex lectularius]|uniref:Ethylmalonyl-CoA decarboxylase n=1 Tax=Cimex lectularius TaxID=79782 RepID=A0A8I6RIA4_CIMLE|nr:ethylmalonyl-CoA decarboxylase-like isoform X2 [Cimex lectularius]
MGKMILEFSEVISTLEKWKEGKALLIRGEGGNFCSGGDLDMVKLLDDKEKAKYLPVIMTDNLKRLSSLPLVTAVYINGSGAIGGGSEIAASADVRIMERGSKIGFVHRKMGIVPAWGGTSRLKRILGSHKALKILLEGRVYDAEESLELGLVDYMEEDLEGARKRLTSLVDGLQYQVAQCIKKSVMSDSIEEQGDICSELIGGEQNKKALMNRVKHKQ